MAFKTIQGTSEEIDEQLNELSVDNHINIVSSNSIVVPTTKELLGYSFNANKTIHTKTLILIPKTKQIPDEN